MLPEIRTVSYCIDHTERMRQAFTNLNAVLVNRNSCYLIRITVDKKGGKNALG